MITPATYDLNCFQEVKAADLKVGQWVIWNQRAKEDIAEAVKVHSPITKISDQEVTFFVHITTGYTQSYPQKSEIHFVTFSVPVPYAILYIYAETDGVILILKPEFEPR